MTKYVILIDEEGEIYIPKPGAVKVVDAANGEPFEVGGVK